MKLSFFTAALIAAMGLHATQAVDLQAMSKNIDFSDYELAEIGGDSEGDGEIKTDAAADEAVNGVSVRLSTPDCKAEEPKKFETEMLGSLQRLGSKGMELHKAL